MYVVHLIRKLEYHSQSLVSPDANRLKDEAGLWIAVTKSSDSAARVAVEKVFANARGTDPNTRDDVNLFSPS